MPQWMRERGTGDRQVGEPLCEEAEDLVAARGGHDPLRVVLDVPDQPVAEVAHPEEVVLFADALDRSARDRVHAVGPDLLFGEVAFLADRIPPGVLGLVDVSLVVQTFQEGRHHGDVFRFGGANEAVVGDAHFLPSRLEASRHDVAQLKRRDALCGRRLLDLLPVFVGSGQEEDVVAGTAPVPREHVGQDGGVGVAEVRLARGVVDGRGQVEGSPWNSASVRVRPRPIIARAYQASVSMKPAKDFS